MHLEHHWIFKQNNRSSNQEICGLNKKKVETKQEQCWVPLANDAWNQDFSDGPLRIDRQINMINLENLISFLQAIAATMSGPLNYKLFYKPREYIFVIRCQKYHRPYPLVN